VLTEFFALQGSKLFFKDGAWRDDCRFTITFGVDSLLITEDNLQCGGLNVPLMANIERSDRPSTE